MTLTAEFIYPENGYLRQVLETEWEDRVRRSSAAEKAEFEGQRVSAWDIYDEHLLRGVHSFQSRFACILPQGIDIKTYVEDFFQDKRGKVVGIEEGGPARNLFAGFEKKFFNKTLGITRHMPPAEDAVESHTILAGDLESEAIQAAIENWSNGEGIDFLVEAMGAGIECLYPNPQTLFRLLQSWYAGMSEKSIMLVQMHPLLVPLMPVVLEKLKPDREKGVLETQLGSKRRDSESSWYFIRFTRLPGSATFLPNLSDEEINTAYTTFRQDSHATLELFPEAAHRQQAVA